jgi:SH3 domain-containing YSC84-like protein 1
MHRSIICLVVAICCLAAIVVPSSAQRKPKPPASKQATEPALPRGHDLTEGASQAGKAAGVFGEIMGSDNGISTDFLNKAECIAVFPSVIKAGFILGGKAGRGVASCRTKSGWSAPAFFEIKGGSVGFQIGAEATDLVLLFMNTNGLKKLVNNKLELGADASIAAGPVGREAAASTDASMNAEILSYSRSRGAFLGVSLKGSVVSPDKSDMEDTYGKGVTALRVLAVGNSSAPSEVQVFANKLGQYSSRKAA